MGVGVPARRCSNGQRRLGGNPLNHREVEYWLAPTRGQALAKQVVALGKLVTAGEAVSGSSRPDMAPNGS
jgi:hypothetical protein